jgi:hypothetical protein
VVRSVEKTAVVGKRLWNQNHRALQSPFAQVGQRFDGAIEQITRNLGPDAGFQRHVEKFVGISPRQVGNLYDLPLPRGN